MLYVVIYRMIYLSLITDNTLMVTYRNSYDSMADLLSVMEFEKTTRVNLVNKANMNDRGLKLLLEKMKDNELINHTGYHWQEQLTDTTPVNGFYSITEKGRDYLRAYKELKKYI